jgi:hypothetical protein
MIVCTGCVFGKRHDKKAVVPVLELEGRLLLADAFYIVALFRRLNGAFVRACFLIDHDKDPVITSNIETMLVPLHELLALGVEDPFPFAITKSIVIDLTAYNLFQEFGVRSIDLFDRFASTTTGKSNKISRHAICAGSEMTPCARMNGRFNGGFIKCGVLIFCDMHYRALKG